MDEIDKGQEREQEDRDYALQEVRRAAAAIPGGSPGECELCGEWAGRLVDGACAPCRDHFRLK